MYGSASNVSGLAHARRRRLPLPFTGRQSLFGHCAQLLDFKTQLSDRFRFLPPGRKLHHQFHGQEKIFRHVIAVPEIISIGLKTMAKPPLAEEITDCRG